MYYNIILCITLLSFGCTHTPKETDVTSSLELLGNPYSEKYKKAEKVYARNIWDLQEFDGRLYIGAGNSSNIGPARNAGPVPVFSFDPVTGKFTNEFTVDDEQIDLFYTFGDKLIVPGHDPRESWKLGNFYQRSANSEWQKVRNIPNAIHTYAMHYSGGNLYAGLGAMNAIPENPKGKRAGSAIAVSEDNGKSWQFVKLGGWRIHGFLEVKGKIYATDIIAGPGYKVFIKKYQRERLYSPVYEINKDMSISRRTDLIDKALFSGLKLTGNFAAKTVKPVKWKDGTVYIGAICHNDHQFYPFGLFHAKDLTKGKVDISSITLPEKGLIWDIMIKDNKFYVLQQSSDNPQKSTVFESSDLQEWHTLLKFKYDSFARSFEIIDGDFYFGIGSEFKNPKKWKEESISNKTGDILRVKKEFINYR